MAEKAPIFDYSKVRDGAASPTSEDRPIAVGQVSGESAVLQDRGGAPVGKPRPSVRRVPQRRSGRAGSLKSVASSLEGGSSEYPAPETGEAGLVGEPSRRPSVKQASARKSKSPSQKRSEKKRGASKKAADGAVSGSVDALDGSRAEEARDSRAVSPGSRNGLPSPSGEKGAAKGSPSGKGRAVSKPQSAGDVSSLVTNGILNLVSAVVEFVKKPHSKAFNRGLVAALALVVALMFIYPSARDYYVATRNNAKAEAEYAALQEYYDQLKDDVETLGTDQGVEDAARDEFGMIMPGDVSLNVKDLESEADFDKNPTEIGITPAGSIEAPEEWYTPFLDFVFGYEG